MPKTIELIYDFVSPNAYLIWQPLREIAARQQADIKITAAFLGGMHKLTGNAPPSSEMQRSRVKMNMPSWRCNDLSKSTSFFGFG